MKIHVYPIASGSSGNVTLISGGKTRFLLDAGTNAKYINNALKMVGITFDELDGIVLTHEHTDHISALKVLTKHKSIPIYASKGTAEALIRNANCSVQNLCPFQAGDGFFLAEFYLKSFQTSHDASDSVGFIINYEGEKAGYATDLGCITREIIDLLKGSETLVIESNHDLDLLKNGAYPYYLKRRILSDLGHLSNDDCASAALEIAKGGARKIILSHLSNENNTAELAFQATFSKLLGAGAENDVEVLVADRRLANMACAL
ncbi:MAG: MBL fold metallo-hydrolase [Clostridiales bacterium]|nr:MBL fold metallo-hydrolase [Clostridiales bacterium]